MIFLTQVEIPFPGDNRSLNTKWKLCVLLSGMQNGATDMRLSIYTKLLFAPAKKPIALAILGKFQYLASGANL